MMPKFNLSAIDLHGPYGNAYWLMGKWTEAAREAGWTEAQIKRVLDEAMSRDYKHLCDTLDDNSDKEIGRSAANG